MLSYQLARVVDAFWHRAGDPGPYPRDAEAMVEWALNLVVFPVTGLGERSARRWLAGHGLPAGDFDQGPSGPATMSTRRPGLHGCLIAFGGRGFVLVEERDPPDEVRFTIAHEAAHFMLDYLLPRERASGLFATAADLLDGVRQPTIEERVAATVSDVDLRPRAWLFARDAGGRGLCSAVGEAEQDADRLAFELLAPGDAVLDLLRARASDLVDEAELSHRIAARFGLVEAAAARYVRQLMRDGVLARSADDWLEGLRGSA